MTELTAVPSAISVSNVCKSFGEVSVLRGCSFRVARGEAHALLGQNGAGKSTLVKILNGVHSSGSFEGEILVNGVSVYFGSPAHARRAGIGYVPQEIEVIEHLSVAENIFVGQAGLNCGFTVNWKKIRAHSLVILEELGLSLAPSTRALALTAAQRHLLMIARALAAHPAVLILDEPTASLSEPEIDCLFAVLRRLKARGTTMIYITHRLAEVTALCDRASVLRDGVVAAELSRDEFSFEKLISAMTGRRMETLFPETRKKAKGASLLKVENLSVQRGGRRKVDDVSFELRAGEILGIAGVLGSGRTELLSAIYGYLRHTGTLFVEGRQCTIGSTREARRAGIALLTEDRKREGLLFNLPLFHNVSIGYLKPFSRFGIIRSNRERQLVVQELQTLNVKAPSPDSPVAYLSGGNQQKLLFARVLLRTPKILLLDEPTKGVDVSTRQEIYELIVALANSGSGVIVVSSELNEVLGLADRCLVMAEGRFIDEFTSGQGTETTVLHSIANVKSRNIQTPSFGPHS